MTKQSVLNEAKKRRTHQAALLEQIIDHFGGVQAVATKLRCSKQLIFAWKKRGYVPLKQVPFVSRVLQVPPLALNYKEYSEIIFSEESWSSIRENCLELLSERQSES